MASLEQLAHSLSALSGVPSRAARAASVRIAGLIRDEFDQGEDAYGESWEELSQATLDKGREEPPLTDTGDLRNAIRVRPVAPAGIGITVDSFYGAFHQTGTRNMPARPILPDGDELPQDWEDAIEDEVDQAFRRAR
jgi:phage gpG-like protein